MNAKIGHKKYMGIGRRYQDHDPQKITFFAKTREKAKEDFCKHCNVPDFSHLAEFSLMEITPDEKQYIVVAEKLLAKGPSTTTLSLEPMTPVVVKPAPPLVLENEYDHYVCVEG